jgi:hypothetical protein
MMGQLRWEYCDNQLKLHEQLYLITDAIKLRTRYAMTADFEQVMGENVLTSITCIGRLSSN